MKRIVPAINTLAVNLFGLAWVLSRSDAELRWWFAPIFVVGLFTTIASVASLMEEL